MSRLVLTVIVAALACASADAQTARSIATPPGITVQAPPLPATPPSPVPAPPVGRPPHGGGYRGAGLHRARADNSSGDLFLAGPYAYAPRSNRWSHGRVHPIPFPYGVPAFTYFSDGSFPWPWMTEAAEPAHIDEPATRVRSHDPSPLTSRVEPLPSSAAPLPPAVITPATPKTFYVIPRCYAGDRPPVASQLPAGCRAEDVQVIPAGR